MSCKVLFGSKSVRKIISMVVEGKAQIGLVVNGGES